MYKRFVILFLGLLLLSACGKTDNNTGDNKLNGDTQEEVNQGRPDGLSVEDAGAASADALTADVGKDTAVVSGAAAETTEGAVSSGASCTVVIDAGHQRNENMEKEKIGPRAKEKKPKVSAGQTGVATGTPEYKINLKVAKKLKRVLERRGYRVVMVRETHDVNISNKERAELANASGDIYIRLHCDFVEDSSESGIMAVCLTADNPYPIRKKFSECENLSLCILGRVCRKTGADNRGILKTDYMAGINFSKIPVTMIEMGCMSNAEEDEKLGKAAYQKKIAKGIAGGIDDFLKGNR